MNVISKKNIENKETRKKLKIVIFAFFIIIALISGSNLNIFHIAAVSAADSSLTIESISSVDTVWAGNTFRIDVKVRNNTDYTQSGVNVITEVSVNSLVSALFTESLPQSIAAYSTASFSFTYKVDPTAKAGEMALIRFTVRNGDIEYGKAERNVIIYENPNSEQPQHFEIVAETYPKRVSAGENIKIAVRFANSGGLANGVIASIECDDANIKPVSLPQKAVGNMLAGENAYVEFDFNVTSKTELGLKKFTLSIYGSNSDLSNTLKYPIGIYVEKSSTGSSGANSPDIRAVSIDLPDTVEKGGKFQLKAVLENTGVDAENVKLTIVCPQGIANTSPNIIQINSLKKGEQKEILFDAVVADSAQEYYNLIELQIEYSIPSETGDTPEKIQKIQYAGLNIAENEKQTRDFTITADIPEKVNAGDDFKLSFTVVNNGTDEKNFFIAAAAPSGIVNKSVNTFPVAELKSGESITREITFSASEEAAGKYCMFNIEVYAKRTETTGGTTGSAGITSDVVFANQFIGTAVSNIETPKVTIDNIAIPETVNIGDTFDVGVTLSNTGAADCENIILSVTLPEKGILNKTASTVKIDLLKSGEKQTETFTFIVTQNANYGYNAFTVEASYSSNISGGSAGSNSGMGGEKISQYIGVTVNSSDLKIDSIDVPASVGIKSDFDVRVAVKNTGADTTDVVLTLTPQTGLINKSANSVKIDSIKSDEIVIKTFTFMALDSAPNGYAAIDVSLVHGEESVKQYSGINVINPEKEKENETTTEQQKPDIPVIIINKFSYGDEATTAVYGGNSFNFTLELLNTHREIAVKDLKITISQEKGIFNPKSGSNTFFVERLEPNQTVEKEIELVVKSDAAPDSYGLQVSLTYKSEKGDTAEASEIINIPVQQEMRFSVGEIPPISDVMMGDDVYVNVQFGNLGKSLIYNAVVKVQGDGFINSEGTYYAGNLEAGKFLSKEFVLTTIMPGMISGKFVFEYEDADENQQSEEHEFAFMVMGGDDTGMDGRPGMVGEGDVIIGPDGQPVMNPNAESDGKTGFWLFTNMNIWKWLIIIGSSAVILAGIIVAIVIIIRRRKQKRAEEEDDEDGDVV